MAIGREGQQGYGLVATQACRKNSVVVKLPKACQLSYGGGTDPALLLLIDKVPQELWGARLALQLLAERLAGEASHFAPYVRNLPVGFDGVPIFYGPQAINALRQYPPVSAQVIRRCKWLVDFASKELAGASGSLAGIDANALGWAMACCSSRAFRIRGPEHPASLLPLIDMCNHSFEPNAKVRPSSKGGMEMFLLRDLKPGERICISYGDLPNDFLLLDYGFIVENNRHDRVQLRFDLRLFEAAMAVSTGSAAGGELVVKPEVAKLLHVLKLMGPQANLEVSFGRDPLVDPRLLTAARALCAQSMDDLKAVQLQRLSDFRGPPMLSPQSEAAAMDALSSMASLVLASFPTTVEQDVQEAEATSDADLQLAVRFRMEKKQVLLGAISAISQRRKAMAR